MNRGHSFSAISANDNARQHNGNAYQGNAFNYTFNFSSYEQTCGSSRKRRRSTSSDEGRDTQAAKDLMDSLYYPGLNDRKERLEGPQPRTFEWIFQMSAELVMPEDENRRWLTEAERRIVWPSFPQWLESCDSNSQYCLLGKAGSGKSTLMAWISRDQEAQTVDHLRKWAGHRSVCILTHFLFRPSGSALGRNFEGLLRSLLFQVLTRMPQLQHIVVSQRRAQSLRDHMEHWTVRALKAALKETIRSAPDCVFCIFIDGVDELQDDGDTEVEPEELVSYLLKLQEDGHVKLCMSSRPTVGSLTRLPTASKTTLQLASLNQLDIMSFVSEAIPRWSESKDRQKLVKELCERADGVFLWASFAVKEIKKWLASEDIPMLRRRLDKMGRRLEEIIAYMLHSLEPEHRTALAFYLKAMKWFKMGVLGRAPSVALLFASQNDITGMSGQALLKCYQREEMRITDWSHGLLEVKSSQDKSELWNLHPEHFELAWVPRHLQHIASGAGAQSLTSGGSSYSWIATTLGPEGRDVVQFEHQMVSWLHRSAYDFFFAPASRSYSITIEELLRCYGDDQVTFALLQGKMRLMLTLTHTCYNICSGCVLYSFRECLNDICRIVRFAGIILGENHNSVLDELRTISLTSHHGCESSGTTSDHTRLVYGLLARNDSNSCPFEHQSPPWRCVPDKCVVNVHTNKQDLKQSTETPSTFNDPPEAVQRLLLEAVFWAACVGSCPSYVVHSRAEFHMRERGGLILASCLDNIAQTHFTSVSLPGEIQSLVSWLLDRLELWCDRFLTRRESDKDTRAAIFDHLEEHEYNSRTYLWKPCEPRRLDSALNKCSFDYKLREYRPEDLKSCIERYVVTALIQILWVTPILSPKLSKFFSMWDIWVDALHTDSGSWRPTTLRCMLPCTADMRKTPDQSNDFGRFPLRLTVEATDGSWTAFHHLSHNMAEEIAADFGAYSTIPSLKVGDEGFLKIAGDLLQDIHQDQSISIEGKSAFQSAISLQAACELHCELTPYNAITAREKDFGLCEEAKAERDRLMSLKFDEE